MDSLSHHSSLAILCVFFINILAVQLFGVCLEPRNLPTLIVLEYMHLGSLEGYLQSYVSNEYALIYGYF